MLFVTLQRALIKLSGDDTSKQIQRTVIVCCNIGVCVCPVQERFVALSLPKYDEPQEKRLLYRRSIYTAQMLLKLYESAPPRKGRQC